MDVLNRLAIGTVLPEDVGGGTLYAGQYDPSGYPEGEGQLLASGSGYATLHVAVDISGTLEWKKVRIEPLGQSRSAGLPYWGT